MNSIIKKFRQKIKQKQAKRDSIVTTIKALKEFQNDLGSQHVINTIGLLVELDKRLFEQINYLKRKIDVFYKQPRC